MGKEQELFLAARTGNTALLERLFASQKKGFASTLRKTLRPNIQDEAGYTPLHHATLHGHKDTVAFLLQCQASTQIADSSGSYPLHLAAWKGDLEIVMLLVQRGPSRANVNQQSNSDDTALHLAAQYGHTETVEYLLQQRANAMLVNIRGETPLDLASLYGRIDTVNLLVSHCPELLSANMHKSFSPLHLAARNGHVIVALSIINAGQNINSVTNMGSALHEAAMYGKMDMVKLLLDKHIDISVKDQDGCTVLEMLGKFTSARYEPIKALIRDAETASQTAASPEAETVLPQSQSTYQLSSGGQMAQERRNTDQINYQYLMMAIPQASGVNKRSSLGQRSTSAMATGPQELDTFLHDSWSDDKPALSRGNTQGSLSGVHIDPGDLAMDSNSLQRMGSHDYQNVSFDDEDEPDLTSPFSDPIPQSTESIPQSTDPFLCDSWTTRGNTIGTSNPSKVAIATTPNLPIAKSLPDYENVWEDQPVAQSAAAAAAAPLQIDFGDLIDTIDKKQQHSSIQQSNGTQDTSKQHKNKSSQGSRLDEEEEDSRDYHKALTKIHSQPIQRSNSLVLSPGNSSSFVDPVTGDPDYENYAEDEEDYANVFDTPSGQPKVISSSYDKLDLKRSNSLSDHTFSLSESSHDPMGGSHELVENHDNPFTGLVITASAINNDKSCHGDLTRSMARSVIRRSNASCLDDQNRNSLWSSDRVEQEFDQIDSVLEKVTAGLEQVDNHSDQQATNVYSWLGQLGMGGYASLLQNNGYDTLRYCGLLDDETLHDMGITAQEDCSTIVAAARLLPSTPNHAHLTTLSDWLNALNLSYLEAKFIINGYGNLRRVAQLQPWDIDLLHSLGVELLGHRKRLTLGVSQLQAAHPEWYSGRQDVDGNFGTTLRLPTFMSATDYYGIYATQEVTGNVFTRRSCVAKITQTSPVAVTDVTRNSDGFTVFSDPKESRPFIQQSSQVAIRPPRVAQQRRIISEPTNDQIYDTLDKPVYERDSWLHSVDDLLKRSVHYHVKYLGSVLLANVRGVSSTKEACLKLRASTFKINKIPEIILSISWKGIKFIDSETRSTVSEHSVHNISYSAQDPTDPRVFAYITKETGSSKSYCHVFMVHDKDAANEVVLTIGQAFEVAYQKMMKARAKVTAAAFEQQLVAEEDSAPPPPMRQSSLKPLTQSLSQLGLGPTTTSTS